MKDEIVIHEYQKANEEAVMDVFLQNVPEYFAAHEAEEFRMFLQEGPSHYYIVSTSDKVIGAGGFDFTKDGNTAFLCWGFLSPSFHHKGIGKILLRYRIEKILQYKNIISLSVRTSQFASDFFERNGFTLKNVVKNYWAEGLDLFEMDYKFIR